MNIYKIIILGVLGICFGIGIHGISDSIIAYKNRKKIAKAPDFILNKKIYGIAFTLNVLLWIYAGITLESFYLALLVSLLFTISIVISVVDLRVRLIPNELILLLICLGVLFQIGYSGWPALPMALLCMAAIGLMFAIAGRFVGFEQVGAGDVKLAAAMGLVIGYPNIMIALVGMTSVLLIYCLGGLFLKKLTRYSTFPFAPFIMFGTISALAYIIVSYG